MPGGKEPNIRPTRSSQKRVFLRQYGKVLPYAVKDKSLGIRFHKYVELDPVTQVRVSCGPPLASTSTSTSTSTRRAS